MIPILYGSIEVLFTNEDDEIFVDENGQAFTQTEMRDDYDTLGVGMLGDCIECIVTEERNGKYELFMTYPVNGRRFKDIHENCIIKAIPSKGRTADYFRIYQITKPLSGIIEINAEHISYQLNLIPVMPFTASSCALALQGLKTNSAEANPFTFWTDKATVATYNQKVPASLRSRLGGTQGSILDVYGGEFEFDKYDVKLYAARGADNGVQLRYGKNITDLTQETNIANTITGICPYWADEDGNCVTLPEQVVQSAMAGRYPFKRTVVKDFSQDFQNQPTEAQLRAKAQSYVTKAGIGVPDVSLEVSFVDLSDTDDYSAIALLEQVKLCDTVTVIFEPFDIDAKAKVVQTEWNVLKDRYESITLGTVRSNLSRIVAENDRATTEAIDDTRSVLQQEIAHATDMITGANGGYVVINRDADGNPTELLVMNTPDIATATRVWRWNQNGLGVSNNGYNGPYETAMTADGHFVADFITAGVLQANLIKAGVLSDENGIYSLNMATGEVTMANATMTGGRLNVGNATQATSVVRIAGQGYTTQLFNGQVNLEQVAGATTYELWLSPTGFTVSTNNGANILFEIFYDTTGGSVLRLRHANGKLRAVLDQDGLTFYNTSGQVTRTYAST